MLPLEWYLERFGYRVINQGYPSTDHSIAELASDALPRALSDCEDAPRVHIVTHSMGGILVRQWMAQNRFDRLGRVVMLGPPNAGSEIVDKLGHIKLFEIMNGPAGMELGTGEGDLPRRLGPANFEFGVIAGTRSLNPLLSAFVEGEDDGKVSVSSALSAGATDHVVLPVSHTFMMMDLTVLSQVERFLASGAFDRDGL